MSAHFKHFQSLGSFGEGGTELYSCDRAALGAAAARCVWSSTRKRSIIRSGGCRHSHRETECRARWSMATCERRRALQKAVAWQRTGNAGSDLVSIEDERLPDPLAGYCSSPHPE